MRKSNIRKSYKKYITTTEEPVDIKVYTKINNLYNKFLCKKAMEGLEVTLPSRMGTIAIVGKKQKVRRDEEGNIRGLAPDWVKTKELWDKNPKAKEDRKLVYHTNNHTSGYRYNWRWSKKNVLVSNKSLYALRMTRTNKRDASNLMLEGRQFMTK